MDSDGAVKIDLILQNKAQGQLTSAMAGMTATAKAGMATMATAGAATSKSMVNDVKSYGNSSKTVHSDVATHASKQMKVIQSSKKNLSNNMRNMDLVFAKESKSVMDTIAKDSGKSFDKVATNAEKATKKTSGHFLSMKGVIAGVFVVLGYMAAQWAIRMVSESAKAAKEFDKLSRNMQAIGELSDEERDYFTNYARQTAASGKSMFGANEIVEAGTQFFATGYGVEDSVFLADLALKLATAGEGMTVDDAASVMIAFKEQMHLDNEGLIVALNQLVKTANVSAAGVSDLSKAWERLGGMAYIYGQDTATINSVLSGIASQVKGEAAGTQVRNILRWFYQPNSVGTKALQELGVSAYYTEGERKGEARNLLDVFSDFALSLGAMTPEQATDWIHMVGSKDYVDDETGEIISGIEVATSLLSQLAGDSLTQQEVLGYVNKIVGAREIAATSTFLSVVPSRYDEREEILNSEGTLDNFFATIMGGSFGKWEGFKKAVMEFGITLGEVLMPAIMIAIDTLAPMMAWFRSVLISVLEQKDLIDGLKEFGADLTQWWGEIVALVSGENEFDTMRIVIMVLTEVLKILAITIMGTIGAIYMFITAIVQTVGRIGVAFVKTVYIILSAVEDVWNTIYRLFEKIGIDIGTFKEHVGSTSFEINQKLDGFMDSLRKTSDELETTTTSVDGFKKSVIDTAVVGKTTPDGGGYTSKAGYNGPDSGSGSGNRSSSGGDYGGAADVIYAGTGLGYDKSSNSYFSTSTGNDVNKEDARKAIAGNGFGNVYHTGGFVQGHGDVPILAQAGELVATKEDQAFLASELQNKQKYDSVLPRVITNATQLLLDSINRLEGAVGNQHTDIILDGRSVAIGMHDYNTDENKRRGVVL